MGRQWDPEEINTSTQLDMGVYRGRFRPVEEVRTKPNETSAGNKLMYVATLEVMEPSAFVGLTQRDNWTIGTDDDPEAADPRTWNASIGAKSMKKALLAAKVPITRDLDACLAALEGHEVLFKVRHSPDKRDPSRTNVNVGDYFALGQRVVGTTVGNGTAPQSVVVQKVPKTFVMQSGNETLQASQPRVVAKPPAAKPVAFRCPTCEWVGLKSEFGAHAATHDDEGDE